MVEPANWNTDAGVHNISYGNFAYNNRVSAAATVRGFDTWNAHGFQGTGVMMNHMAWANER